jgi:four helix bundle protein
MSIQSYRDLDAWKIAMKLAVAVYEITKVLPREELYGLSAQLRRAVVSIPSNISEGHQQGTRSYAHFVTLALGSLAEMETQLELATRLGYLTPTEPIPISLLGVHTRRILHGLRRITCPHVATTSNPPEPEPDP